MLQARGFKCLIVLICPLLLFLVSCDYKGPDALWNPDYDLGITPVIENVSPEDVAVAGISQIIINGQNFSTDASQNTVYFGNARVDVKQASANQLVVYRPNLAAENFAVKVAVEGSVMHGVFSPYSVESIGGLYVEAKTIGKANAIAMASDGTLYLHVDKKDLYRVTPLGDMELVIDNTKPKSVYDMKVGPDGYIYFARDRNYIQRALLEGDGVEREFEDFGDGIRGNIKYFDFDINLNIFAGGAKTGLFFIKSDGTNENLGIYNDFDIKSIRVFDNAVYVAALYTGEDTSIPEAGIWKTDITSADGQVGDLTLVLDWSSTGDFTETQFTDINFDEDGVLFVATDGGPDNSLDPVLMVTLDGSVETFYKGGLLQGIVYELMWSNDAALFYLRDIGDVNLYEIHRLDMAVNGAPEFGRQ
ncbi:IPT/TIG domain-containing protein [bacterium]